MIMLKQFQVWNGVHKKNYIHTGFPVKLHWWLVEYVRKSRSRLKRSLRFDTALCKKACRGEHVSDTQGLLR